MGPLQLRNALFYFLGELLGTLRAPPKNKKVHFSIVRGTQVPPNIACFRTNNYLTLSLNKKVQFSIVRGTQVPPNIARFRTNNYLTLSLNKKKVYLLIWLNSFLGTLRDPKSSPKK